MNLIEDEIANCSVCQCSMDITMLAPFTNVACPECGEHNRVNTDVGSYVLMKRQGIGGMSLVFGAVDKTLGRQVAIKILNEDYSMDEKRIEQFEQEARITAAMSHPHIVKVFTVGQAFRRFFIAMELVAGDSLEKKMEDEGKLPESDILQWAQQIADGLNAANEAGLIHRDIKPGNILFDLEGHVKIVDFGLALVTQGGKAQADEIWATPYYVPPEALDNAEEDFRSDIYALGASLFHALSGQPPFTTETRSTTELKDLKRDLPSLKETAPWLSDETCEVIDKSMSFEMDDRYDSYQELIDALHYAESSVNNDGEKPPLGSAERAKRRFKSKKKQGKLLAAVAGLGVLVVGGILFLAFKNNEKQEEQETPVVMLNSKSGNKAEKMSKSVGAQITMARGSLKNKNYAEAAKTYTKIATDKKLSKDTAYWAALQSATVHLLNGSPRKARTQFHQAFNIDTSDSTIGDRIKQTAKSFMSYQVTDPNSYPEVNDDIDAIICFATALKNWSSGETEKSLALFQRVEQYNPSDDLSDELQVYRSKIQDYKHDAAILKSFRGNYSPMSMEDIRGRVAKLESAKPKLRTKGRVQFDLKEWNTQCELHEKRLKRESKDAAIAKAKAKAAELAKIAENKVVEPPKPEIKDWDGLMQSISEDLAGCHFEKVVQYLELVNLPEDIDKLRKEQLKYLCRNAEEFKKNIRLNLKGIKLTNSIKLKDGSEFTTIVKISVNELDLKGEQGRRKVKWGEVEPGDLLELYQYIDYSKLNTVKKGERLEDVICFAWLIGEKPRAEKAAKKLKLYPVIANRWRDCMKLLK